MQYSWMTQRSVVDKDGNRFEMDIKDQATPKILRVYDKIKRRERRKKAIIFLVGFLAGILVSLISHSIIISK